jgi:heterodisulfide reductase subunit A
MLDVGRHPNIELMAYSEVEKVEGETGDFKVTVRRKARYVDEDRCTGCGACSEKCPSILPDAFDLGLGKRKAIYSWFAQGIPSTHTIDSENCRQLQGKKCGICKKTCEADAVNFEQEDRVMELHVGAIIVAPGYEVFDPSPIPEYRYGDIPNVVTALEFERLLSASGPTGGHLDRPSDLAAKAEIAVLEKKAKKARKSLEKLEEKYNESSSEFFEQYERGEYEGDEDRKKWADKYTDYLAITEPLEALREKAGVSAPAISDSILSVRGIVACTPSKRRSLPTSTNQRPDPRSLAWIFEPWEKDLKNTKFVAAIRQASPMCVVGSPRLQRGPTTSQCSPMRTPVRGRSKAKNLTW